MVILLCISRAEQTVQMFKAVSLQQKSVHSITDGIQNVSLQKEETFHLVSFSFCELQSSLGKRHDFQDHTCINVCLASPPSPSTQHPLPLSYTKVCAGTIFAGSMSLFMPSAAFMGHSTNS